MSRRWWIAVLLFLATAVNYLDRQVLSVTAPVLREQLHISAIEYSRILFAFMLAYAGMQMVAGRMVDRVGPKAALAIAMAWWSLAGMLHASAQTVWHLGAMRFLLGIGEAGNWPASVKAVRQWFPPHQTALAVGVFNSGSCLGGLVAPPLIAWLTLTYSWRAAFVATGALGLAWLLLWWPGYGTPPALAAADDQGEAVRWRNLLRRRSLWGLMAARFCCDPVWWFYVFWLPDYLHSARGLDLKQIGAIAWVPFLTAGAGNLAGGWLSGYLIARGSAAPRARKLVMVASAVLMLAGLWAVGAPTAGGAIAAISLVTFAYSCWAANILTLPADVFENAALGTAAGICGSAAGVGGMLSTLTIGWLVERVSYAPAFAAAAAAPIAAAGFILILVRQPQSNEIPHQAPIRPK
ncbi:MAG: MFS transporter [Bryobacterales bacterium]|nr:MFS transporter [Bryobacterales bacterium]